MTAVTGTFTATGSSAFLTPVIQSFDIQRNMNLSLSGTWAATVLVERSFDEGVTFLEVASHTANTEGNVAEQETGVQYRLRCSAFTSGTVVFRISV